MTRITNKQLAKSRRHRRVRAKIKGTKSCPRLSVFRSNKHIYAQLIDDEKGKTLAAVSDSQAYEVGKLIAQKALKDLKIKKVVFDKGPYKYHGRIKRLAEGAREEGLKF